LERLRVPRWLGAPLVVVVALGVVALVLWIVVAGLLSGLSSATVLIVGVVTGLFILLFLMKDWRLALRLHPLVVMLVTTAGTLLFGILGATLAAPVTAVALRTGPPAPGYRVVRSTNAGVGPLQGHGVELQHVRDHRHERRRVQAEIGGSLSLGQHLGFQEAVEQPAQLGADSFRHRDGGKVLGHLVNQDLGVQLRGLGGLEASRHARTIPTPRPPKRSPPVRHSGSWRQSGALILTHHG
jgi:hypothetical protein